MSRKKLSQLNSITNSTITGSDLILVTDSSANQSKSLTFTELNKRFAEKNTLTTKGDVYVFDGTNLIRLGVGTNGQLLTADSGEASGLKWANAPATGATLHNTTFTGTTITATTDQFQKFRYTGSSAKTVGTFGFSSLPDGGKLIVTGSSNTNTITIPDSLTNVRMNGKVVLYKYSAIEFIKDNTQLIEVSRNGI